MASERSSQAGLLAAWTVSALAACIPFCEARLDPNEINPFREERPEDEAVAKAKAFIARRRWIAMTRLAKG